MSNPIQSLSQYNANLWRTFSARNEKDQTNILLKTAAVALAAFIVIGTLIGGFTALVTTPLIAAGTFIYQLNNSNASASALGRVWEEIKDPIKY